MFVCFFCQPEPPSLLSFICLNTKRLLTAFQMNNSNTNNKINGLIADIKHTDGGSCPSASRGLSGLAVPPADRARASSLLGSGSVAGGTFMYKCGTEMKLSKAARYFGAVGLFLEYLNLFCFCLFVCSVKTMFYSGGGEICEGCKQTR